MENYVGEFVAVVSCVTEDLPHRPHPHEIVSKMNQKKGVHSQKFDRADMTAEFDTLGIRRVTIPKLKESLERRKALRIDPFKSTC